MSCITLTGDFTRRLVTTNTSYRYEPVTNWAPAVGVDYIRAIMKIKSKGGLQDLSVRPAIQVTTAVPADPDDWAGFGADPLLTNAGAESSARVDVTATTASKMFYRLGVAYKAGASGEASGDVSLQAAVETYGKIAGVLKDLHLVAPDTSSYYLPIGGWMPTLMVSKIKAAIILTQASANLRVGLAYQLAPHVVESPSAWADVGSTYGSGVNNTGEQSITVSDNEMWVRLGLLYTMTSGSNGQGIATVLGGVRKK